MRKHLSPALILSVIAVVLTSTGGAFAATLITGRQVKDSSLTGRDIKNKSLTPADFSGSVQGPRGLPGPQGSAGAQGTQGPAGPQGPAGIAGIAAVQGPDVTVAPGDVGSATATCPAGTVVGTGFFAGVGDVGFAQKFGNFVGIAVVNNTTIFITIHAQAICASGPGATAAAVRSTTRDPAGVRDFNAALDRFKASRAAQ